MKKLLALLLVVILVFVGCAGGNGNNTSSTVYKEKITIYKVADGGTSFYLKPVEKMIKFEQKPTATEQMKVALELLAEKTPSTATVWSPLPADAKVLDIKVKGDTAWVNFSDGILHNPGAGAEGEMLALCSIPLTLKQFGVNKVYILINGQVPSEENGYIDFWGHVGLYDQPLTATGCMDTP